MPSSREAYFRNLAAHCSPPPLFSFIAYPVDLDSSPPLLLSASGLNIYLWIGKAQCQNKSMFPTVLMCMTWQYPAQLAHWQLEFCVFFSLLEVCCIGVSILLSITMRSNPEAYWCKTVGFKMSLYFWILFQCLKCKRHYTYAIEEPFWVPQRTFQWTQPFFLCVKIIWIIWRPFSHKEHFVKYKYYLNIKGSSWNQKYNKEHLKVYILIMNNVIRCIFYFMYNLTHLFIYCSLFTRIYTITFLLKKWSMISKEKTNYFSLST